MTEQSWEEAVYNQQKDWEKEQEFYASESAKAEADIKTQEEEDKMNWQETVMSDEQIANTYDGMPKYVDVTQRMVAQAQAEISFRAGIREVVDWVKEQDKNSDLPLKYITPEKANAESHKSVYMAIPWNKWQAKLKEWRIE